MQVLEKILEEIESLHNKILKDRFAEQVTEQEIDSLIKVKEIVRYYMDEAKDTNVPSNVGWIPVEERLPEDCEEIVLVQVSGKMAENIWFDNAFELATYVNGEGWILENYPEWQNPKVIAWQPLPEPYKPKKDIAASGKEHIMSRFMTVE